MPVIIKLLISACLARGLAYLISYAVWELKSGTKRGGIAALCAAAVSAAVFAVTIGHI